MIYMSYKLVKIDWLDTVEHPSGWYQPEDIYKLEEVALVHSYGLILKETEESITLIADFMPISKEFGRSTTIPKGMIKNITHITTVEKQFLL